MLEDGFRLAVPIGIGSTYPADYYATMDEEDVAVLRVAADLLIASSPHDA
jgi:hypothetical protein